MKAKEFSRTYNIPHGIVYEATFAFGGTYDFDPAELAAEVRRLAMKRAKYHRDRLEKCKNVMKNLEGV